MIAGEICVIADGIRNENEEDAVRYVLSSILVVITLLLWQGIVSVLFCLSVCVGQTVSTKMSLIPHDFEDELTTNVTWTGLCYAKWQKISLPESNP